MTTAFVLSGGGSLGAVQVGMLQALAANGVEPDLVVGTSVGALNGAFVACHGTSPEALDDLAAVWRGIRRRDVFPLDPARLGAAAVGRAPSLCDPQRLRRLVAGHLPVERVEQAAIPLHVVATDVCSGRKVVLDRGDVVDAVVASAAIPGVFPSVHVEGVDLVDGGVADNAAISTAVAAGADVVYVLPTGYACALDEPPATVLGSAIHALTLLVEQRLVLEVERLRDTVEIHVLPPLCPLSVASVDFRYGGLLVERSRLAALRWLERGDDRLPRPERFLSLHDHQGHGRKRGAA